MKEGGGYDPLSKCRLGGWSRAAVISVVFVSICVSAVRAQTFNIIHDFGVMNGDGWRPYAGVTLDKSGNLYGTTQWGGYHGGACDGAGCGIVFKLSPNQDGTWSEGVLHRFQASDGAGPSTSVVLDSHGNVYGTTASIGGGYGTVFQLTPQAGGGWTLTTLHAFTGSWDGGYDYNHPDGGLALSDAGHLYGATQAYGIHNFGVIFNLGRISALSWYELLAHAFSGGSDGGSPRAAPTVGPDGNVYGTTFDGGSNGAGTVYRVTPNKRNFGWTETVLYSFQGAPYGAGNDGANPWGPVIFDEIGNLYGTTGWGGPAAAGSVFELSPNPDGSWTETVLYSFKGNSDGETPTGPLGIDQAGNLYGATLVGGQASNGTIYRLVATPTGEWNKTILHSLAGGGDGASPWGEWFWMAMAIFMVPP